MLAPLPGHLDSWQGPRPADQLRPCCPSVLGGGAVHTGGSVSKLGRELSRTQMWGSSASDSPSKTRSGGHVGYTDWPTRRGLCLPEPTSGGPSPRPAGLAQWSRVWWRRCGHWPGPVCRGCRLNTPHSCSPAGHRRTWVSLSRSQGAGRAGSPQGLQKGVRPLCFSSSVAHGCFLPPAPEPSIT